MPNSRPRPRRSARLSSGTPSGRPGFVVAALGVALLVVAGVVVSVLAAFGGEAPGGGEDAPAELARSTPTLDARADPRPAGAGDTLSPSRCGLSEPGAPDPAESEEWRLAIAPETSWRDVDVNLAPSAPATGPGETHEAGFASCFQRSPEGALFAAANFLVQSNTAGLRGPLLDHALAPGPHRDALLAASKSGAESGSSGELIRLQIVGYRMLAFDGQTARVDVAQRVTVDGASNFIAAVVDLEWVDGDWRIPTDDPHPVRMQALGDVGGYVRWGA
ncbi:hypothetical protein [Pseudoclavibacter terrae]|uniref:DUF8175 domain-containing protein n=1 Tax=Pseudoclavibacter terrae TaxID=1530195 RepID=A0A7J5B1K0_9MICO|nr:hypothetical protein [Pseudoclavibacter terrae]KAB1637797.1 hypothetical protein F8O03_11420 [Pseudoclavibacter terrae]